MTPTITLAEFIAGIRSELEKAAQQQQARRLADSAGLVGDLIVKDVVLEADVKVERDVKTEGKLSYWIAGVGGAATSGTTQTQKVRITLSPKDPLVLGDPQLKAIIEEQSRD